jgi:hypothetical protein
MTARQFVTPAVDAEFPDDPKRKASAIRRAPLTLRSGSRIVAAGVLKSG